MILEGMNSVGGKFLDKTKVKTGTKIKIVSEAATVEGQFGPQVVAKVIVQGDPETYNMNINKTSIRGMISAFGKDTAKWVGQVVTADIRRESVSGKMQNVMRLIPAGHELSEDGEGYLTISKARSNGLTSAGTPVPFSEPVSTTFASTPSKGEDDIDPMSIDF
jgi:hypothetical protein